MPVVPDVRLVPGRRCVPPRQLSGCRRFREALRPGAVVTVLLRPVASMSQEVIEQFTEMEPKVLAMQTIVPLSFAVHDEALLSVCKQTQARPASQGSAFAAKVLLRRATANSFQMVTSPQQGHK